MGDQEAAIEAYREAGDAEAGFLAPRHALVELYRDGQRWQEAAGALGELARAEKEENARDALWREIAQLVETYDLELSLGVQAYESLSHREEKEEDALAVLYLRMRSFEKLAKFPQCFARFDENDRWLVVEGLTGVGEFEVARECMGHILTDSGARREAWQRLERLWKGCGATELLARFRISSLDQESPEDVLWHKLLIYSEMVEVGLDPQPTGIDVEEELSAIDLQEPSMALAAFRAAKAAGLQDWVDRSSRALETMLPEDPGQMVEVLRARANRELEAGDPNKAVELCKRLLELEDPMRNSRSSWPWNVPVEGMSSSPCYGNVPNGRWMVRARCGCVWRSC